MSASLVAGSVRGRALAGRRLGRDGIGRLRECSGLEEAIGLLTTSVYGRQLEPEMDAEEVEYEIGATGLWHLRVLAGWLPPRGVEAVRPFTMWFEMSNILAHVIALARGERPAGPVRYTVGRLGTAWGRVERSGSLEDVRRALAASDFGDPGGASLTELLAGVHLG